MLIALGLVPFANLVAGPATVPWWPAAVGEWVVAGGAIVLAAMGLGWVLGERVDRIVAYARAGVLRLSPRVFQTLVALLVLALTAVFALYCFARKPFAQDEMAQQFHAQILLAGRLFAVGEPHPEFFSITGVLDHAGRWYSMYPIGGPALLAAGAVVHATWLVNPLLTAVTACALYRFTASCFGEGPARAGTLLFALSPMVVIMGASSMNHVGALALATVALASLVTWTTAPDARTITRAAVVVGLAVGGIATIRPLDAAAVALVVGAFQLVVVARDRTRIRSLAIQVAAGVLPVVWLLYVNARTTGRPLLFAYDALYGGGQRLGFHTDPLGVAYTPLRAIVLASTNLMRLDRYLFEWPLPGLLPIVAALLFLRRPTQWDLLLVGLIGVVMAAYGVYWAADSFFAGPRFLYTAVPAFVIFAARAPGLVAETLSSAAGRRAALLIVPLCLCVAWLTPTGVSSVQMRAYYYHAGRTKLKTDIEGEIAGARLSRALVFVHEPWRARLEARLRAFGVTPGEASRILGSSDACRVQTALDVEDGRADADTTSRVARLRDAIRTDAPVRPVWGLQADAVIFLAARPLTDACKRELAADTAGTTPYAPFLVLARFDPEGRIGGPVVFARDFGPRNDLLRPRFPDRAWFRYRPRRSLDDTTAAIVPY